MKFKLTSIIVGAIAIAVAATPLSAKADDTTSGTGSVVTQQSPHSPFAGLNLSQQQQDQIAQIRSSTRSQIQQVLTSEQQNQLQATIQAGQKPRAAFQSLNLSDQQKNQIKQLWQSARQQMKAVLTPEQRQQIQARIQQRQVQPTPNQ